MLILLAIALVLLAAVALAVLILAEARQGADLEASMRRFDSRPAAVGLNDSYRAERQAA